MSAMQRTKGKVGEREASALIREHTGWDVRRRVRQHDGDSDLLGAPGWAIEVKRTATALPSQVSAWWAQAVAQCAGGEAPLLLYRANRREWRAVWPLCIALGMTWKDANHWHGIDWTAETTVEAWAAVARDALP